MTHPEEVDRVATHLEQDPVGAATFAMEELAKVAGIPRVLRSEAAPLRVFFERTSSISAKTRAVIRTE